MKKLSNIKWPRNLNYMIVGAIMLLFVILSFCGAVKISTVYLLEEIAIKIVLALSLSLVVGFLGELSLGHAGFMCVGAYLGGKIATVLAASLGNDILALIIALVVGGACAGICGFLIGLPALRLRGDYLAITTLAFGEIVKTIFQNVLPNVFGGPTGFKAPKFNGKYFYIICFIVVLVTLAVIQNLIRSKHGRAIKAIRDNEIAAKAMGINVTNYKLFVFIIAAVFAGIAGVLHSYTMAGNVECVTPKVFDYNASIAILVMVVLGGMKSINGVMISAVFITFLSRTLENNLPSKYAVLKDIIYALVLIAVVIYNNAPALKTFREEHNLKSVFAKKKRAALDTAQKEVE